MLKYQNPDKIRDREGISVRVSRIPKNVVSNRMVWASGTSCNDAEPDVAMQKAWENLLAKVDEIVTSNQYRNKYIHIMFRNDIYDASSSSWTVTLTASIDIA